MTSPPALAKRSASSATESPPQALSIREMHLRKTHVCRSPNSPLSTENSLKKQYFYHRHTLNHHQNERQKTPAVISGDFDGALLPTWTNIIIAVIFVIIVTVIRLLRNYRQRNRKFSP